MKLSLENALKTLKKIYQTIKITSLYSKNA